MNLAKKAAGSEVGQFPVENKAVGGDLTGGCSTGQLWKHPIVEFGVTECGASLQ